MANLDRETQDRYEVVVRATDMAGQLGGLSGSTTVTIVITDVNDNPPRFPQSKALAGGRGREDDHSRAGLRLLLRTPRAPAPGRPHPCTARGGNPGEWWQGLSLQALIAS